MSIVSDSTLCSTQSQKKANTGVLWTYLQRKSTVAEGSGVPLPPLAPVDKTGTSVRILLHDTQAHFEKFSDRVEKITKAFEDSSREMVQLKSLFEKSGDDQLRSSTKIQSRKNDEDKK